MECTVADLICRTAYIDSIILYFNDDITVDLLLQLTLRALNCDFI
jgi:hypothetical protein